VYLGDYCVDCFFEGGTEAKAGLICKGFMIVQVFESGRRGSSESPRDFCVEIYFCSDFT
jgi:hypothetical protein